MKPLAFTPLFMERVWGGRALEGLGKALPAGQRVGESWEIVDRADAQSVLATGPHAGTGLNALWSGPDRERLFGERSRDAGDRFPILVKLLDARETLSVQVHPPASVAEELGGEPKNELWYLLGASEDAHLFAGLRSGVTRERFAATLEAGEDVSGLLHRIPVAEGDALFIPSGRVHAIGAGCLIVEIQQNSDTTYRVSDFDRPGLDGRPRELHVPEALASIDFDDVEPPLRGPGNGVVEANAFFAVTRLTLSDEPVDVAVPGECALVTVLGGEASCGGQRFAPGSCFLVPASGELPVAGPCEVLVAELPEAPRAP